MEFHIVSEEHNPVMKRREIRMEMKYNGATPSKAHVQEHVAAKLSVNPDNVEVSKILSNYGKSSGKVWVKVWEHKKVPLYSKAEKPAEAKAEPVPAKTEGKKSE